MADKRRFIHLPDTDFIDALIKSKGILSHAADLLEMERSTFKRECKARGISMTTGIPSGQTERDKNRRWAHIANGDMMTAMVKSGGRLSVASKSLGIPEKTFRRELEVRGISKDHGRREAEEARRKEIKTAQEAKQWRMQYDDTGCEILSISDEVRTVDDALQKGQIDLELWEVDKCIVNAWGQTESVQLWQVKVWLKKRKTAETTIFWRQTLDDIKAYSPNYKAITKRVKSALAKPPTGNCLLEFCPTDGHFGKLAFAKESGANFDTRIASDLFLDSTERLLARAAGYHISQIVLVLGSDLFHSPSMENRTKSGHVLDVDGRYHKTWRVVRETYVTVMEMLLQIAPVLIKWVPGNHDEEVSFYFAETLAAWFHKCDSVTLDESLSPRKYLRFGLNLLGWQHINKNEKFMPLIMAQEQHRDWAQTEYRQWHVGHFHKRAETKYTSADTFAGVGVRVLRSLSAADVWHHENGFINGDRGLEAFVWHEEEGPIAEYAVNIPRNGGRPGLVPGLALL